MKPSHSDAKKFKDGGKAIAERKAEASQFKKGSPEYRRAMGFDNEKIQAKARLENDIMARDMADLPPITKIDPGTKSTVMDPKKAPLAYRKAMGKIKHDQWKKQKAEMGIVDSPTDLEEFQAQRAAIAARRKTPQMIQADLAGKRATWAAMSPAERAAKQEANRVRTHESLATIQQPPPGSRGQPPAPRLPMPTEGWKNPNAAQTAPPIDSQQGFKKGGVVRGVGLAKKGHGKGTMR